MDIDVNKEDEFDWSTVANIDNSDGNNKEITNNNANTNSNSNKIDVSMHMDSAMNSAVYQSGFPALDFPMDADFLQQDELVGTQGYVYGKEPVQWAVIQFQQPGKHLCVY